MNYQSLLHSVREVAMCCGRNPDEIKLIAVSKGCCIDAMHSVYAEGGREFGESRMVEAFEKISLMNQDCKWHFIGRLQSKKIAKVLPYFQLIHSVDTFALAKKIADASQKQGRVTSVLLQVNTSGEATKQGMLQEEWEGHIEALQTLSHLKIEGLMTMAPFTEDQQRIRICFRRLAQLLKRWRPFMSHPDVFEHLSMGMSHDYAIAIEEGATLLRIGSLLFQSPRN